jgi:hypothetical protein
MDRKPPAIPPQRNQGAQPQTKQQLPAPSIFKKQHMLVLRPPGTSAFCPQQCHPCTSLHPQSQGSMMSTHCLSHCASISPAHTLHPLSTTHPHPHSHRFLAPSRIAAIHTLPHPTHTCGCLVCCNTTGGGVSRSCSSSAPRCCSTCWMCGRNSDKGRGAPSVSSGMPPSGISVSKQLLTVRRRSDRAGMLGAPLGSSSRICGGKSRQRQIYERGADMKQPHQETLARVSKCQL